jgi:hypothetical protein
MSSQHRNKKNKQKMNKTKKSNLMASFDNSSKHLIGVLEIFKEYQNAAIATETWSSNTSDSYITVTEHHVSSD